MNLNTDIDKHESDKLNTDEIAEYQHWVRMVREVCEIRTVLERHPDKQGLEQARSKAYNVLADIQIIMDMMAHKA